MMSSKDENGKKFNTSRAMSIYDELLKEEHQPGLNCSSCPDDFPKQCSCGGLIHVVRADEEPPDEYYKITKCDSCGVEDEV